LAFNGSGTFVRVHNWVTDRDAAVKILATRHDAEDDGFATGLSATICRNGESTTTASIPFAAGITVTGAAITLTSGQIAFPATQAASSGANTLDDYEEGSTTPTVTSSVGTFTTVSTNLYYTKIGNLVRFNAIVEITDSGTAAGTLTLPLPFTPGTAATALAMTSTGLTGGGISSAANYVINKYDGTTIIVNGTFLYVTGTFRV